MKADNELKLYSLCPVCSSKIKAWRHKKAGDLVYQIDICLSCGYSFVNPRPSLSFLMDLYSSSVNKTDGNDKRLESLNSILLQEKDFPNSTIDAKSIIRTIKSHSKGDENRRFLDIGCGYGFFSKEAIDAGFEVEAIELGKNEIEITKEMTGLQPVLCSFEEFECAAETYSVVLMSQILEHALDVNLWIKKANDILIKDGIIAIALPNYSSLFRRILQDKESFICPPEHLNFFNPNSITRLLENHGFKILTIKWISRIPKRSFEKLIPKARKPIISILDTISHASLKAIDAFHLGMIINVYARKINT